MEFKILSTKDFMRQNGVKMGLYGKPASGKTPLAASAPRPLFLAGESGLGSIVAHNIPYLPLGTKPDDIKQLIAWLNVPANIAQYDTIVYDSLTFHSHAVFSTIKASFVTKEPRLYYAQLKDVMVPLIECILALPKNVVVIFWQGEYYEKKMFKYNAPVAAGGALADYCMHFFDTIVHLSDHEVPWLNEEGLQYVDEYQRPLTRQQKMLQTKELNAIFARDRMGKLADYEVPDLSALFTKLTT